MASIIKCVCAESSSSSCATVFGVSDTCQLGVGRAWHYLKSKMAIRFIIMIRTVIYTCFAFAIELTFIISSLSHSISALLCSAVMRLSLCKLCIFRRRRRRRLDFCLFVSVTVWPAAISFFKTKSASSSLPWVSFYTPLHWCHPCRSLLCMCPSFSMWMN